MKEQKNTTQAAAHEKKNILAYEDIPVEGSLGLLALGAVGLKAWRKKRDEAKKENSGDKNE